MSRSTSNNDPKSTPFPYEIPESVQRSLSEYVTPTWKHYFRGGTYGVLPVGLSILSDWHRDLSDQISVLDAEVRNLTGEYNESDDPQLLADAHATRTILKAVKRTVNDWDNLYNVALTYEYDPFVREEMREHLATEEAAKDPGATQSHESPSESVSEPPPADEETTQRPPEYRPEFVPESVKNALNVCDRELRDLWQNPGSGPSGEPFHADLMYQILAEISCHVKALEHISQDVMNQWPMTKDPRHGIAHVLWTTVSGLRRLIDPGFMLINHVGLYAAHDPEVQKAVDAVRRVMPVPDAASSPQPEAVQ